MSVQPVLQHDHDGPWRWDDLPDREELHGWRAEICDGALVLMPPPPGLGHDLMAFELALLLRNACPPGLRATAPGSVEYRLTYRQPDAMVFVDGDLPDRPLPPSRVVLVVEAQSPGSVTNDRITKAHEYASVGIEHYWRLEAEPEPLLQAFALVDGTYAEVATVRGEQSHTFSEPFPVTVCPAALLRA